LIPSLTLDTNIYISALRYGGKPMALVEMGLEGELDIAVSQEIIDETLRVFREKFRFSAVDLQEAEATIRASARVVKPTRTINVIQYDDPDNRILECAAQAGSEYIVTGDKDLLRLGQHEGIKIVKVGDFLREIQAGRR
jgi:putative PIN family toxin of toxin-antitoxin system